jgi:hypothetical protein
MSYTNEQKEEMFDKVCELIASGISLRKSLTEIKLNKRVLVEKSVERREQYARAREEREDVIFEEMLEISNTPCEGVEITEKPLGVEIKKGDMLGHRKLQIDTRKWMLSKMSPKKYGDKVDVTSKDEKIDYNFQIEIVKNPD